MGTYISRSASHATRSYNTTAVVPSTTTMIFPGLLFLFCVGGAFAQYHPTTTPVPILKQINRHNEDGSYSYGFEAADGSYKIESKYPTGEVYGKYGFIDDTGNLREVEYGASRRGFEPAGTDINVPPPTLTGNSINGNNEPDDDGQYREDPSIYYTDPKYTNGERYEPIPRQQYQQPSYQRPAPRPLLYNPAQHSKSVAAAYRQPVASQSRDYQPQFRAQYQQYQNSQLIKRYDRQPASNTDDNLSTYSVEYKR